MLIFGDTGHSEGSPPLNALHKPKFSLAEKNDYFHLNLAWHQHFLFLWFRYHCSLCQFLRIHLEAWNNSKCPDSQSNCRAWESNSVSTSRQHPWAWGQDGWRQMLLLVPLRMGGRELQWIDLFLVFCFRAATSESEWAKCKWKNKARLGWGQIKITSAYDSEHHGESQPTQLSRNKYTCVSRPGFFPRPNPPSFPNSL